MSAQKDYDINDNVDKICFMLIEMFYVTSKKQVWLSFLWEYLVVLYPAEEFFAEKSLTE